MKYLLDTHAFLWYLLGNSNLSVKAKNIIDTKDIALRASQKSKVKSQKFINHRLEISPMS